MRRTLLTLSVVISFRLPRHARPGPISHNAQLALVGGTIYASPTEEPIRNGVILIDGDKIVAVGRRASVRVPRGTSVIDSTGSTITAGFWNSHRPLPRENVGRCRDAPSVRAQRGSSNDAHPIWVHERVRHLVVVGEHATAARSHRVGRGGRSEDPRHRAGDVPEGCRSDRHKWSCRRRRPGPLLGFMPQEKIQLDACGGGRPKRSRTRRSCLTSARTASNSTSYPPAETVSECGQPHSVAGEGSPRQRQTGLRSSNDHRRADGVSASRCRRAGAHDAAIGAVERKRPYRDVAGPRRSHSDAVVLALRDAS